jgi:hypothetical protein
MSNIKAIFVSSYELDAVEAYLHGKEPSDLGDLYEDLGVPDEAEPSQIEIAVAQILLHGSQKRLPQWGCVNGDGKVVRGRAKLKRPQGAEPITLHPQHLLCINWADSGPGFSWPEAYHITRIPGFDKYIVTASRDSPDAWGCTDHAIGFCDANVPIKEAAREIITNYWSKQAGEWEQARWAYLFDEGLISGAEANSWADEVWGDPEELHSEEEEEDFWKIHDAKNPKPTNQRKQNG